jgi:hypothetical protein
MVHLPSAPLGGSSSEAVVKHLFPDSINTNQIDSVLFARSGFDCLPVRVRTQTGGSAALVYE